MDYNAKNIIGTTMLIVFLFPLAGYGQSGDSSTPDAASCYSEYTKAIAREHRIYKQQLFGHKEASEARTGALLHDKTGQPWLKQKDNSWVSIDNTKPDSHFETEHEIDGYLLTLTDADTEREQRYPRGILAQTGVLTSDIIPELVYNLASFDCRLKTLCEHLKQSTLPRANYEEPIDIYLDGCSTYSAPPIEACRLRDVTEQTPVTVSCQEVIEPIIARETELLLFITEYDAANRTLLQLEGMNSLFLRALQWHIEQTLSPFTRLMGFIETIPCFVSSCDATDTFK